MATSSVALELGQIVKQLVAENDLDDESAGLLKGRKLMFMVQNSIMTGTLQDLMDKLALSSESVLELHYAFALDKPKLAASLPQEEWISRIRPMSQFGSNKATDYIVAFFNGDVKLFAGDSKEMLEVKGVHEEAIVDALYLHEQDGSRKVITVSEQPGPALKMFEVSLNKASMNLVAKASDDMAEA